MGLGVGEREEFGRGDNVRLCHRLTASRRRTEDIGCTKTLMAVMKQGQGKGRGESWVVIE